MLSLLTEKIIILLFSFGLCLLAILIIFSSSQDRSGPWYDDIHITCSYGNINNVGRIEPAKNAMYTKDLIFCTGYRVTMPYNSKYFYEVHYFTADDRWIGGEVVTTSGVHLVENGSIPSLVEDDGTVVPAAGIRIVLLSSDGKNIGFWSKLVAHNVLTLDVYAKSRPDVDNVWKPPFSKPAGSKDTATEVPTVTAPDMYYPGNGNSGSM